MTHTQTGMRGLRASGAIGADKGLGDPCGQVVLSQPGEDPKGGL